MTGASESETLDVKGLLCPLPVIRTQDRVKGLPPGALLSVLATDPGVLEDLPAWCRVHGHELLEASRVPAPEGSLTGPEFKIRLRVRG
jgi:tRNA 2-thiouridine synthesizing protein A